jgi:RP/EB family microtubule-associated protein
LIQELRKQNAEIKETMEGIERERDFYFNKLRDIEIICQNNKDSPLIDKIIEILFVFIYLFYLI